jgi:hypothetical protein
MVRGVGVPAEAEALRDPSRAVSRDKMPAGLSAGKVGWRSFDVFTQRTGRKSEMRKPMTNRMDDEAWVMGIMEPILLMLLIAIIAALVQLL